MFLSEHKMTYEEWLKKNHNLLKEETETNKQKAYEEYVKKFDNDSN